MKDDHLSYERMDADPHEKKLFIRQLFDAVVPTYDVLNRVLSLGIDQTWRRAAIRNLSPLSGKRVIDLCCGTGDLSRLLRKRGAVTLSIDFSRKMILKGLNKKALSGLAAVADASFLPYQNSFFNGAAIAFGIRNIPDIGPFLKEVRRVLAPGGRFVILELVRPENPIVNSIYKVYLHGLLPLAGRLVSGDKTAYRYLAETIATFIDPADLSFLLTAYGFEDVRIHRKTFGIAAVISCKKGEPS
jgi:demethylmenaquinone methyltransferase/2-methoxy-6-polyprenyl-1,4-benzoquinol methylase